MEKKTKGDIKATLILLTYIGVGCASGYLLESVTLHKDGAGYPLGFFMGILTLRLLKCIWEFIRMDIDD